MKLGVLTVPLYSMKLEEAMEYLSGLGVQTIELEPVVFLAIPTPQNILTVKSQSRNYKLC